MNVSIYFSPSFLLWVWPALSFLSSPLCGRNLLMVEIALVAGSKKEKERKEASFLVSLGALVVVESLHPWRCSCCGRTLQGGEEGALVVSHLGRSLPTQRPRLEEEYGRRPRGFCLQKKRYTSI